MIRPDSRLDSGTTASLIVAALQYRALPTDKAENLRCLLELVSEAAQNGAGIIVLPELCTTGMNFRNRAEAASQAETIPGPASDAFAGLARRHQTYIVLGLAETEPATGKMYNSQVLLGPDGLIVGRYRKIHTFGPDLNWAEPGDLGYQAVMVTGR